MNTVLPGRPTHNISDTEVCTQCLYASWVKCFIAMQLFRKGQRRKSEACPKDDEAKTDAPPLLVCLQNQRPVKAQSMAQSIIFEDRGAGGSARFLKHPSASSQARLMKCPAGEPPALPPGT